MAKHDNSRVLAIKLSVTLGYELRRNCPGIAKGFTAGYSHAALAEDLRNKKGYEHYGASVMEHAVRFSLIGNDNEDIGPVYRGAMSPETYAIHSARHRTAARTSCGILSTRKRSGIHALDGEKLSEFAIRGAIARGETPWTRKELSTILSLSLREMFKLNGHIDYGSIADVINRQVYQGKEVRTNVSVREALRRLQRSFSKNKGIIE